MFPDDLLHPDHVVPAAEFVPAFMECSHPGEAQVLMKLRAVPGQIFILLNRTADAGILTGDLPDLVSS